MHFILLLIALLAGAGEGPGDNPPAQDQASDQASDHATDQASGTDAASPAPGPVLVAEPQEPSGRFTTATEVRPILDATRGNWVAVREYGGQDLVYFTHLLSWRCGLVQLDYGINGGAMTRFAMPPCHADMAAPNAILETDGLPYVAFAPGSVQSVEVRITYDDLGSDEAGFARKDVAIP